MTATASASSNGERPLAILAGAFFAQLIVGFGFITFSLLAPSLAAETGLNERDFGLSITFFFIGTALSSPLTGSLVAALGSVATLVTAMTAMACAYLVCLTGTWSAVMLAAFLFGLGYGPQGPVGMTLVTERTPAASRGLFLSIRQAAQPLAAAIAGRVLPPLVAVAGWQAGVITTSTLLALGALFIAFAQPLFRVRRWRPVTATRRQKRASPGFLAGLADFVQVPRELRLLWGVGLILAASQMAMMIFSYLYLLEVIGLSPIAAGIFVSNQQLAGMIGRPLCGWLCDITRRSTMVLGMISVTTIATIIGLKFAEPGMPGWQLLLLAIATGIAGQTWNAVFTTAMSYRVAPEQLTELNGRAFAFLSLGWMATPPLFWVLIEYSGGYELPFMVVLGANALAAILLFVFGRRDRPR
jgi:MFS family permease